MTDDEILEAAAGFMLRQRQAPEGWYSVALVRFARHIESRAIHTPPSIEACEVAGRLDNVLEDTADDLARFESYMRGPGWFVGAYDAKTNSYDTTLVHMLVRMLYGVWRDRGGLSAQIADEPQRHSEVKV